MILISIIIVVILIIFYINYNNTIEYFDDLRNYTNTNIKIHKNRIPKIIWSYWHDLSKVPHVVTKCINTWLHTNEDYNVILLDNDIFEEYTGLNVKNAFSITNCKTYQKISDYIRLNIIYMYGGIWLDASIICMESLNWIQDIDSEFIGYWVPSDNKDCVIESWFLAAIKGSPFMSDWSQEFNKSLQYTNTGDYCKEMVKKYNISDELKYMLPYLTIHLCNVVIRFNNPHKYKLHIIKSIETGGPFYYHHLNKFNPKKICKYLKNNKIPNVRIFKIVSILREYIIHNNDNYNKSNKFIKYVFDNTY